MSNVSRAGFETLPTRQRSRVTNNSSKVPDTDGRSAWTRRLRDVMASHIGGLGANLGTVIRSRDSVT